jgi:hypothetical protein
VPALVGAVAVPAPTAPAVLPEKYSNVAAGDRFVWPPTPLTIADAGCVVPSYVCGVAHVIATLAAAFWTVRLVLPLLGLWVLSGPYAAPIAWVPVPTAVGV